MASSSTEICNMAIAHLGIGKQIASLDERSKEANVCNQFYETARKNTLRAFAWPFATRIVTLGLVEEEPTDEWGFSYRYPSDCLYFRRILSGARNDDLDTQVPLEVYSDSTGKLIYTDKEDAEAEVTFDIDDESKFDLDFTLAMSYLLASMIAPTLAGVQRLELVKAMLELHAFYVGQAQQSAAGEIKKERLPESEFIRNREGVREYLDNSWIRRQI